MIATCYQTRPLMKIEDMEFHTTTIDHIIHILVIGSQDHTWKREAFWAFTLIQQYVPVRVPTVLLKAWRVVLVL
jgi:hypothetical protein